jgi:FXSXX-COOH protein
MDSVAGDRLDDEIDEIDDPERQRPNFIDVSGLPLRDIIAADDTVLGHSMRRLLAELDCPEEIIAAHSSYAR